MTEPPANPFEQPSAPYEGYAASPGAVPPQYPQYAQYPTYPGAVPPYGTLAPAAARNGLGIAAMVCGIVGIVLSWLGLTLIFSIVPLALGILGIVFGIIGRKRVKRGEATNRGMATSGVITGSIAVALSVVLAILMTTLIVVEENKLQDCLDSGHSSFYCEDRYGFFN